MSNPVEASRQTGILRDCDDDFKSTLPAGSFELAKTENDSRPYLIFVCPCGCREITSIPVIQGGQVEGVQAWAWDGDSEKPTLKPSILRMSVCAWHGYLTAGVWESC